MRVGAVASCDLGHLQRLREFAVVEHAIVVTVPGFHKGWHLAHIGNPIAVAIVVALVWDAVLVAVVAAAEREQIFAFLEANRIDGVILISADRHRSDVWRIEREDGYDLYEFESSKLTNIHTHKVMPGALFGYNKKCSFGLLRFDTTKPDPQVTYQIINIDNELIYELSLRKSQLTHKKAG